MNLRAIAWFSRAVNTPAYLLFCALPVLLAGLALSLGGDSAGSPWLRVMIALLVFMLPGGLLFVLLPARADWDLIDVAGYGFAFSLALITFLGLITRTLALSIDAVLFIWFLLAILGFASAFLRMRSLPLLNLRPSAPNAALLAIVLMLVALFAHASILSTGSAKDQYRNHAAINGFLRKQPLGWQEPYFESGNPIADRMYLTYWVLAQALVVKISGAPILLARYLINPFVMLMSVTALYIFARNLRHSRAWSLVLVCLALLAFSLLADVDTQAGTRFFVRAQLDKVVAAFALAPIAISSAYLAWRERHWRAGVAFAATLLATCCVHAIMGAFAAGVIMLFCLIRFISQASDRGIVLSIALLSLALLSPLIILRLETTETSIYNFDSVNENEPKRMIVHDTPNPLNNGEKFYAISPLAASHLTYLLTPLTFLCVLARRRDARSHLLLAFAISVAIGLLPLTAWIYGRLVSFNHVLRILWLFPYGYVIGYVMETAWMLVCQCSRRVERWSQRANADGLRLVLAALALALTVVFAAENPRFDLSRDIADAASGDRDLLAVAALIDSQHEGRVWVAASEKHRERILALGWKVISLSRYSPERMAYYSNLLIADAIAQTEDNLHLYASNAPVAEKLAIIDRYGIEYLLFAPQYARQVDALYQTDKQRFELVFSGESLRLVRVHPKPSG